MNLSNCAQEEDMYLLVGFCVTQKKFHLVVLLVSNSSLLSADCVFGGVLLISSLKLYLKIGPL